MGQWGSVEVMQIAQRITSSCSVFGSCTVCFLFLYLRWWNSSTHHVILFCISISDILWSTTFIVGPWVLTNNTWCKFQGWLGHMFGLATQMWCSLLGLNLWLQMKFYWKDRRCRQMMKYYHGIVWGTTLILSILPITQDVIGPVEGWCQIRSEESAWSLWTLHVPLWINFGFNLCIIIMVIRILR